jgi:hypothetical protein
MTDFTHDVAISAVSYDSMLVAELSGHLAHRVGPGLFWRAERHDMRPDPVADLAAASVMTESARVVVVLHQRLWGHDPVTAADAVALRERVRAKRHKSIRVVKLDAAPVPSWLKTAHNCVMTEAGIERVADAVIDGVVAAGATVMAKPAAAPVIPAVVRPAWSEGHQTFMSQPRAQSALKREFEMLTSELADRVKFESDRLGDKQVEMHCAPQRLVVQLGPVGLSMSWVAGRSGNLADGRLLVIEWDGSITHRRHMGGAKTASPTREQTYRPVANGPDDWCWRPEDGEGSSYSSRNLAGQCFTSANMGRTS